MEATPMQIAAAEVRLADMKSLKAKLQTLKRRPDLLGLKPLVISEGEQALIAAALDQLSTALHDARFCDTAREMLTEEGAEYVALLDAVESQSL